MSFPMVWHRCKCPECGAIIEARDKRGMEKRLEAHKNAFHSKEFVIYKEKK